MEILNSYPILTYLFIFFARVIDVSLGVLRLLLLTRGFAVPAAAIGFVEVSIFVVALGTVVAGGLTDFMKVLAYSGGFAIGNLVGMRIEEFMAVGYAVVQMFPDEEQSHKLVTILRENNYGVTSIPGEGKCGPREILVVTINRKNLCDIIEIMKEVDPNIFFNTSDIRSIHGGVFPRKKSLLK